MINENRKSERGGAGVKLLLVALVLGLLANAGYQYVPVAYEGANFKQEMQTAVINGVSMPAIGKTSVDIVKEKILSAARTNNLPSNSVIQVRQLSNTVQAHVTYSKPVPVLPFGLYTRNYEFDHTATPSGFLTQ